MSNLVYFHCLFMEFSETHAFSLLLISMLVNAKYYTLSTVEIFKTTPLFVILQFRLLD